MKISIERLTNEAENTRFRPEILEKVIHLMGLLGAFHNDSFISSRVALKGGTALNLFCYNCPRLSVDIDLNYIGSPERSVMLEERNELITRIENICLDKNYRSLRKPSEHAGGKWTLRYNSSLQGSPRLEVDLNFLTRVPLWPTKKQQSISLGSYQVDAFPVLDKHELAGGKLKALFSRHSSRDLFDAYLLLQDKHLDLKKLRIAFIVYGGMSRTDWRTIRIEQINYEWIEFKNMLLPMLKHNEIGDSKLWVKTMLETTQENLKQLLPFKMNEQEFLNQLLDFGNICPELITDNLSLQQKIHQQPGLQWKAINVKKHYSIFDVAED